MDKYEYNVKSDQIKKLYSRKEFEAAAKIADEIDWYRVKDNTMINRVADIYENTKQYEKAKEVLLIAYERSPLGRQLAYKLTILALRTKNFVEADEFYQDFVEMSPSDVSQYLLKYRIAKAKGEDIEVLIKILEAYIEVEMDERWQYELAKLYHEAGEDDKCIAMCDELELWFNDGKYVDKARELKKLITGVLTEYNKRYAKDNVAKSNIASSNIVSTEDSKNITSVSNGESDNLEVNAPNVNAGSIDEYDEDSEDDTQADNWNQVDALGRERVSKVNEESDEDEEAESEDHTGMRSLAEAIVAGKEERKTSKYNKKKDDEEVLEDNLELLDDNISDDDDEYLDDEISAEDEARANANAAAKEVARRAEEAEKNIPKLTAEEIAANEALKAAEAAALEAQRAADLARQLVMEAKLRAEQVKGTSGTPSDKYKGMTADEISKSLESEDMLSGNSDLRKKDSMIEIFEFDKDKEGKVSNIGEELTKTAEIDIDEINIRLADENNLYNTANIQAALAKSMEKLMNDEKKVRNAFEMQIDDDNDEIRPTIEEDDNNEILPAIEDDDSYLDDDDEDVYDDSADTTENVKESENVSEVEEVEESEIINEPENVIEAENTPETAEENSATENTVNVEEIKETESIPEVKTVEEAKDIPEVETVGEAKDIPEVETVEEAKDIPEAETVGEAKDIPEVETIVESDEYSKVNEESAPIEEIRNSEETEEVKSVETVSDEDEIEDDLIDEPTKRIDRAEINRILNASKNIYQSLPKSVFENTEEEVETKVEMTKPEEDDQIEGQMTLEEVLAEFKDNEADKTNDNESDELKENTNETSEEATENADETIDEVLENANETSEEATENADETIDEVSENANETSEEATDKSSVASADFVVKNHRIPEEYRSLFNDFVGTGSMEEKIADTLDNLINKFVMDGTSKTNNVIITGSAKIGKTTLGLSLIKAANRGRNRSGRKVAKVKASVLNKRGVALAMTQILGTDLIIEQAGNLMPNTIIDLMIAMKNYTEEMLIVLEDDKAAIDRMLDNSPDLKGFFSNRLDIHEMEIDDMVKIAKDYAEEQFYIIDEMGELALYAKLDDISGRNPVLSIEDIQEVIDDAIAHANRFSLGKIFGRIHKNKDDMRVLSEQDFL
ncbi:hypothetical protein [Bovifimicola ammoniilytica]|uniref:hypothetical protein n=1 Tax=Bovifimicola ammoniilytica TaxID=2981720 RepID=UPI0008226412|nr:hypothetical protein [Bovifimicola ammoniilytica]MCU6754064.1 hypothetical protein [Bovifimicola ammoniilytica]SCJ79643.1 Uncharacterised protein [uncultured Eubacterium sp.]